MRPKSKSAYQILVFLSVAAANFPQTLKIFFVLEEFYPLSIYLQHPLFLHTGQFPAEGGAVHIQILGQFLMTERDLSPAVGILLQRVKVHKNSCPQTRLGEELIFNVQNPHFSRHFL